MRTMNTNWWNEVFEELGWYNREDEEDAAEPETRYEKGCPICGTFTGLHKFSWEK